MSVIATLDTSKLDQLLVDIDLQAPKLIEAVARDVEGKAKMFAPVDTGFLRNSIEAESAGHLTWRINVWAEYGIWQEIGTSRMAAQPFLLPAVEMAQQSYKEAWRRFFL